MSITSWNSELPSGRNPFWIKDEALAGLGLHRGDAVSVDTKQEPQEGDLVLVEVETDELSDRIVRRYFPGPAEDEVRLVAASPEAADLCVPTERMIVLGVVCGRVRFEPAGVDGTLVVETAI